MEYNIDIYKVGNKYIILNKEEYKVLIKTVADIVRCEIKSVIEAMGEGRADASIEFVSKSKHVIDGNAAYIPMSKLKSVMIDVVNFHLYGLHSILSITITENTAKDIVASEDRRLTGLLLAEDEMLTKVAGLYLEKIENASQPKIPRHPKCKRSAVINIMASHGHEPFEVYIKDATIDSFKGLTEEIHYAMADKITKELIPRLVSIANTEQGASYNQNITQLFAMPELDYIRQIGDKTLTLNVARMTIDMVEAYKSGNYQDKNWINTIIGRLQELTSFRAISSTLSINISEVLEVVSEETVKSF